VLHPTKEVHTTAQETMNGTTKPAKERQEIMSRTKKRSTLKHLYKICNHPRSRWGECADPWHFSFKHGKTHHRFSLDKRLGKHVDKDTAEIEAGKIWLQIKSGTFDKPAPISDMTVRQLMDEYLVRVVVPDHPRTAQAYRWAFNTMAQTVLPHPTGGTLPLGDWRQTDVVTDTINRFREVRRANGTGVVGTNRHLGLLRVLFNWAIGAGYREATPFVRGSKAVIKLQKEQPRTRRLREGEEDQLLAQCGSHLKAIVIAAIDSGMRRGEILSLQWSQIEGLTLVETKGKWSIKWHPQATFVLPWMKTKTRTERRVPISTRLRSVLEMRRLDPNGDPLPLDAYVFGTEVGTRILNIKRAWMTAVLKSHGITPTYSKTQNFDTTSRAALDQIDLHLHDLRRECGSRWMDAGVPIATIQRWLGHANVSQTSTYLAGVATVEHDHFARFEAHQTACNTLATKPRTPGKTRVRTAARHDRKPNKTGVDRDQAIM
jgi:integrase